MSDIVQGLPALVGLVRAKLDAIGAANADERGRYLSECDEYAKRLSVLKSENLAVKSYLDVDVTVSKDDVHEIAEAIRNLRGEP